MRTFTDINSCMIICLSDSYQEIEATLTEMDSCMKLLFPDFDLTDVKEKVSGRSTPISKPATADEEQPCCSEDLRDERKEEPTESKRRNPKKEEREGKDEEKTRKEKHGDGENEKKQKEDEEGSEEEELPDKDLFIRNSGLISHAYSLDLNLSAGRDFYWSL